MIQVGDKLPAGKLQEFVEVEGNIGGQACTIGPNTFDVETASAGKTIAIFGLPGAFTPTCSAQHVPGYIEEAAALKAAGVDEIWCVSVNDPFVMGAWARDQKSHGKVRMMADGSAISPRRPGSPSTSRRVAWAFARSAIRCSSRTASSRPSTSKRPASSR